MCGVSLIFIASKKLNELLIHNIEQVNAEAEEIAIEIKTIEQELDKGLEVLFQSIENMKGELKTKSLDILSIIYKIEQDQNGKLNFDNFIR
jgi:UDP-glucose 6-dehydrogenase